MNKRTAVMVKGAEVKPGYLYEDEDGCQTMVKSVTPTESCRDGLLVETGNGPYVLSKDADYTVLVEDN